MDDVGHLEAGSAGLGRGQVIASAQATLRDTSVVFGGVGDSAPSADRVRRIRAHIHSVAHSSACIAYVDLFSVQRALREQVAIFHVIGYFVPFESNDD